MPIRTKNIAWVIFAVIIGAGIFWWTSIKKTFVRKAITNTIQKKTDSLYKITYDTSEIDEVSGDAYLRNVQVKLDSSKWLKLVEKDSTPSVTISLTIAKITVKGLKQLKLLSNHAIDVSNIIIEKPVLRLDKWTRKQKPAEEANDTLEIYKRLVGNFDFLKAKNIQVIDGDFTFMNRLKKDSVSAKGINIDIDDFLVDSAHNYRNILSYFIKQTRAKINSFSTKTVRTGGVEYDSRHQLIKVENLSTIAKHPHSFSVKAIEVTGLSTASFIYAGQVNAKKILFKDANISIVPDGKKKNPVMPSMLPAGSVDSFVVQKGNFTIHTQKGSNVLMKDVDVLLKNVRAKAGAIPVEEYLVPSRCRFAIGSVKLSMGLHDVNVRQVTYPENADLLRISLVQVKPTITRQQLKIKIGKLEDMFDITASNVTIEKPSLGKLIKDNLIDIDAVSLQMSLHNFNDLTLTVDSVKRQEGVFPYEQLKKSKMAIDIRTINVKNSTIAYEERVPKSGLDGTVFFSQVNGKLTNLTNIPEKIAQNNTLKLVASAKVMGVADLHTEWNMLLNAKDGSFQVTGHVNAFPLTGLNSAFEPLGMVRITSGSAEQLDFGINGNHEGSTGTELFNYNDLKVNVLKKNGEDSLVKKGFMSFLTNADIRNNNHAQKGRNFQVKKDRYKSIFNLLWKSVFEGGRNTILVVKPPRL